jgi:hypothetical protein
MTDALSLPLFERIRDLVRDLLPARPKKDIVFPGGAP